MNVSHLLRFFAGYSRTKTKRVGQKINTRSQVYVFFSKLFVVDRTVDQSSIGRFEILLKYCSSISVIGH